jgi:hypothetical protein
MIRETKKHEDEQTSSRLQVEKVSDELARATSQRVINETKLSELDHLVGQLLSVNESLLKQLSGKTTMKKKVISENNSKTKLSSTKSSNRGITNLLKKDAGVIDTTQLQGMHEMYKTLAKSIVKGTTVTSSKKKLKTRISKKKKEDDEKTTKNLSNNERDSSVYSDARKSVKIHIPKAEFTRDISFAEEDEKPSHNYQDVISSLENEFDELNDQYRRLLNSASRAPASHAAAEVFRSDDLVEVIEKLHRKGEQLRAIKSPPR